MNRDHLLTLFIVVLLMVMTSSGTVLAYQQLIIAKPSTLLFDFASSEFIIQAVSFSGFDLSSNTYLFCAVTVLNSGPSSDAPELSVVIYGAPGVPIASGSYAGSSVAPGATGTTAVQLTWITGKSLADANSGMVVCI